MSEPGGELGSPPELGRAPGNARAGNELGGPPGNAPAGDGDGPAGRAGEDADILELPLEAAPLPELARQVMLVRAGEATVGFVVEEVAAVVEHGHMSLVPKAPAGVLGIMNHVGSVVTVVSLAAVLGLPETPSPAGAAPFVVVVEHEERVGLCVTRIDGITLTVELDQDLVTDGPEGAPGPFSRGWLAYDGKTVRLLDGAAIVNEVLARFERRERRA